MIQFINHLYNQHTTEGLYAWGATIALASILLTVALGKWRRSRPLRVSTARPVRHNPARGNGLHLLLEISGYPESPDVHLRH